MKKRAVRAEAVSNNNTRACNATLSGFEDLSGAVSDIRRPNNSSAGIASRIPNSVYGAHESNIALSCFEDLSDAVKDIREDAWDFLEDPCDLLALAPCKACSTTLSSTSSSASYTGKKVNTEPQQKSQ